MRKICCVFLVLLLLLSMLTACGKEEEVEQSSEPPVSEQVSQEPEESEEPTPTPEPEPIVATLTVAGDAMCHTPQISDAYVEETGEYDFTPMLRYAKPWVEQADLAIVNLETTFAGGPNYTGYPTFNTPDALGYALQDAGFDLAATTNNHSLDKGFSGLTRTLDVLDEIGLPHVGTYRTQEERDENNGIVVVDCGGISIAVLAYSYGTNGIPVPSGKEYCINLFNTDYADYMRTLDTELLESDMAAARALDCDLIAVIMHWGIEYQLQPNSYQESLAETLIDLGADLVLGGHPHVLEPYGFVTTEAGSTGFVCYSLGNFISSQVYEYTDTTVLLNLTLEKDQVTGETTVTDVSYVPFYMLNKGQKINGERMVLLDVYAAMAEYESGDTSTVTSTVYAKLQTALENCHTILGAEGDLQRAESGE